MSDRYTYFRCRREFAGAPPDYIVVVFDGKRPKAKPRLDGPWLTLAAAKEAHPADVMGGIDDGWTQMVVQEKGS